MKKITVTYYSILREISGRDEEVITTAASNLNELYDELRLRYNFPLKANQLAVAVNDNFAKLDNDFKDGDHIVFIPPVAGG